VGARSNSSLVRTAALIALGSLAVHQLRYLLAYGAGAGAELSHQGHAYLAQLLPVLLGFAFAGLAAGLVRAAMRPRGPAPASSSSIARAALYAVAIASVFALQESAEGLLSAGHPSGLAGVFGGGGWIALFLSALLGVLCAALDRGLVVLESLVAELAGPPARRRAPVRCGVARPRAAAPLALLPLAFGLARRPPPLAP
jgi:hypothetical protein